MVPFPQVIPVLIENLDSLVFPVGNVQKSFGVHRKSVRDLKLARSRTGATPSFHPIAILVELHDPLASISIGDKKISVSTERHIGRSIEGFHLVGRIALGPIRATCLP